MAGKKALLMGASGLTGGQLLALLLESSEYEKVVIYVRKSLKMNHPKLVEKIIDFDKLDSSIEANDVFCCLGTTMKKAGSKQAFEKVDLDFPLKLAKLQKDAGSSKFLIVSAMGASTTSSFFYNKVKGRLEDALMGMKFPSLFIFRPSLITGNRKENRMTEKIAVVLFRFIDPLLFGPLKKYRSVSAEAIAKCMLHFANTKEPGTKIILSDEIKSFQQ